MSALGAASEPVWWSWCLVASPCWSSSNLFEMPATLHSIVGHARRLGATPPGARPPPAAQWTPPAPRLGLQQHLDDVVLLLVEHPVGLVRLRQWQRVGEHPPAHAQGEQRSRLMWAGARDGRRHPVRLRAPRRATRLKSTSPRVILSAMSAQYFWHHSCPPRRLMPFSISGPRLNPLALQGRTASNRQ